MTRRIAWPLLALALLLPPALAQDGGIESLRQTGKAFSAVAKKVAFIQVQGVQRTTKRARIPGLSMTTCSAASSVTSSRASRAAPRRKNRTAPSIEGSGFVFAQSADTAYVLTNNHVVRCRRAHGIIPTGASSPPRCNCPAPIWPCWSPGHGAARCTWGLGRQRWANGWWRGRPSRLSQTLIHRVVSARDARA